MASLHSPNTTHQHVLVIEDEGDICLFLDILLKSRDAKIAHVKTLFNAYLFLKRHQPDLILLDNRLPDGYGIDQVGADIFLSKPFTKQQFHSCLDQMSN
jgi:DNA-binding NtrC family response regulator